MFPGNPPDPAPDGPSAPPEPHPQLVEPPEAPAPATGPVRRIRGSSDGLSRLALVLVVLMAASALFLGGFSLGARVATTPGTPASEEQKFEPFWDVYHLIGNQYAGSPRPTDDQLVGAAIDGMMQSLKDPYSFFQGPEDFSNSTRDVAGQAEGIGVIVQLQTVDAAATAACEAVGNGCELAVVRPIPGSPAEAAGVLAGDVITGVDGSPLDGLKLDAITAKIKGPSGSKVTLTIRRGNETLGISIVRGIFDQPEVTARTLADGAVSYIAIAGINPVASRQFKDALDTALAEGRRAFVIDLRGDRGGSVPDVPVMAGEFLDGGVVLYQEDASGSVSAMNATAGGRATDPSIRVAVLVDKDTASAAEILAGALQARGRALLIGEKTFGKGVVQAWVPLSNNLGGVHLTIARWLTPDKVWIQGKGLTPDVPVSAEGARAGSDPVLDAALGTLGYPPAPSASPSPSASPAPPAATAPTGG